LIESECAIKEIFGEIPNRKTNDRAGVFGELGSSYLQEGDFAAPED
jgi:hypothetical protein